MSARASTDQLNRYLDVATRAARAAGAVIRSAWNTDKRVHFKGAQDLVTDTDQKCEDLIMGAIRDAFPEHKFIGEEQCAKLGYTPELTDDPTWMCDPLDGTTNFVHGYPFSCVSIGLAIDKRPVVGVVYAPILDELYTATLGGGAFLNGQPIRCSDTTELSRALFATEMGVSRDDETMNAIFDRVHKLTSATRSLRACGSCAMNMCGVACGRLDAFYEIGFGGCWDVAAGACILSEAGGQLLDPAGGPFDVMGRRALGANAHLGPQVAQILAGCKVSSKEPQPRESPAGAV